MITSSSSPLHVNAATSGASVTPSDSEEVDFNGIYVGGDGDLVVTLADGNDITLKSAVAGTIYPLKIIKVKEDGTTATDLVGLRW